MCHEKILAGVGRCQENLWHVSAGVRQVLSRCQQVSQDVLAGDISKYDPQCAIWEWVLRAAHGMHSVNYCFFSICQASVSGEDKGGEQQTTLMSLLCFIG